MLQAGLIGEPIDHSRSPAMHNAAFAALGIDAAYTLWPTGPAHLAERVAMLRQPGMLGANVTIPHKRAVIPLLDSLAASAEEVGAVNTIVAVDGKLSGHNTDGAGLELALREAGMPSPRVGMILGTGGAARAAVLALRRLGVTELAIIGRDRGAAADILALGGLPGALLAIPPDDDDGEFAHALRASSIIINATPVGSNQHPGLPFAARWFGLLAADALVVDLIVDQTDWLRAAQQYGKRTQNGTTMLLYQGALALTLWLRAPAPLEVMRRALAN